jgi:hypothetical protein
VWKRLTEWYGTRLAEQYGETPPPDWCEVVDDSDNNTVTLALSQIKHKHTIHPPTFPEFDALFAKAKAPAPGQSGPTIQDRLCDFVLQHRSLTPNQIRLPWKYIGREFDAPGLDGKMRHNHGVEITGVIVPADGDHPGYRVMLADLQLEAAA